MSTAICIEMTLLHSIPRSMTVEYHMKKKDFMPILLTNIETALAQNHYTEGTFAS